MNAPPLVICKFISKINHAKLSKLSSWNKKYMYQVYRQVPNSEFLNLFWTLFELLNSFWTFLKDTTSFTKCYAGSVYNTFVMYCNKFFGYFCNIFCYERNNICHGMKLSHKPVQSTELVFYHSTTYYYFNFTSFYSLNAEEV